MKRLNELRQQRAKLHDRNKELLALVEKPVDDRPGKLTDEQINAEYEAAETQIGTLDKEIGELEKWEKRKTINDEAIKHSQASVGTAVPVHAGGPAGEDDEARLAEKTMRREIARQSAGSLQNIRGVRNGMQPEERAYRIGMWGLAIASITLPRRYRFTKAIKFAEQQALIVHGEGSGDTTGAHLLVPDEFSADLIDLKESYGVCRRLFGREAMAGDTKSIARRKGGLTAYATAENAAGTESNAAYDDVLLVAKKWMVLSRMSKELDEDNVVGFGDRLAGEVSYAFAKAEDGAGINGDASATYNGVRGIRTRLQDVDGAGTDSAGLVTGAGNLWSELVLADFHNVVAVIPDYADSDNAAWLCHRAFYYGVMQKLELAAGGTSAMEIREGNRRPRPLFLGYPVEFSNTFPSSAANSSVVATLGDYQIGATFADRRRDEIEFDDTVVVGGQSVWERDQIAIKGTERNDIVIHEVGTAAAAGAICGLQTAGS